MTKHFRRTISVLLRDWSCGAFMPKQRKILKVVKSHKVKPFRIRTEDLRFASENHKLAGLPGVITDAIRHHRPDWDAMVESAERFGAQVSPRMRRLVAAARRGKLKAAESPRSKPKSKE